MPRASGSVILELIGDESTIRRQLKGIAVDASKSANASINNSFMALGRISGKASEFQKSMEASNARVIAFGATAGQIFAIKKAFDLLVNSTIEVERQLTEIDSIFQLGRTSLQRFSADLSAVANNTSMAFSEAAKAATEFSRQGLSVEETLKRTNAALALSRLSGIGVEESVSSLTATLNSFTREALDAGEVLNRLTAVDAQYAISLDDIAKGLSRVSASANDAKVTFNETVALITAAQQITARGGSVIGNAFKSIFTRLQRPKVLDDLESAGIEVRNLQGQVKPMIEILKNLATTYDTLSSSQKSFVSETVGGVYQVNVLKAVLKDVSSGASVFDGAMTAAANSSGTAERRLKSLNSTVSSQLVRTMNELTRAFSNVGNSLISPTIKNGLSGFEDLMNKVANITDSQKKRDGSVLEQTASTGISGVLKGASNILQGPGIQFAVTILLKLFEKLIKFSVESINDLKGITDKEKQRVTLNESLVGYLQQQKGMFESILAGTMSVEEATEQWLNHLIQVNRQLKDMNVVGEAMTTYAANRVVIKNKADGHIPNLSMEASLARQGGYTAGQVVQTTVNSGAGRTPVIANTNETKSSIAGGDFINPPANSLAGRRHRMNALAATGIDPYTLPQSAVAAHGSIPNLAIKDIEAGLQSAGIPDWTLHRPENTKYASLERMPENFLQAVLTRYHKSPKDIILWLRSASRLVNTEKNAANFPKTGEEYWNWMRATATNKPEVIGKGLARDLRTDDNRLNEDELAKFISSIVGKHYESPNADDPGDFALDPAHVQMMLNRYGPSFKTVAAYNSLGDLTPAGDAPDHVSPLRVKLPSGQEHNFTIPTPVLGHKTYFAEKFAPLLEFWKQYTNNPNANASDIATQFGEGFDQNMKILAAQEGVRPSSKRASIDLPGAVKSILSQTNSTGGVSGIELKGSMSSALSGEGNLAEKIFRTLAGEPVGRSLEQGAKTAHMKGPVEAVPLLANVPQFNPKAGGIGILDYTKFGSTSQSEFQAAIYAAIAQGKPLKVNYGPRGSGSSTAAADLANQFNTAGSDNYVKNIGDLDRFSQVILASSARSSLDKRIHGLAMSAASQVEAFKPNPQTSEEHEAKTLLEYQASMSFLSKKLGSRFTYHALGGIPNLASIPLMKTVFNQAHGLSNGKNVIAKLREGTGLSDSAFMRVAQKFGLSGRQLAEPFGEDIMAYDSIPAKWAFGIQDLARATYGKDAYVNMYGQHADALVDLLHENQGLHKFKTFDELTAAVDKKVGRPGGIKAARFVASGMIPNVKDALMRENMATGGHGILSSSAMLRSPSNPMGLAAIDSRNQHNADQAIMQHMALGQSMSDIKRQKSAQGYVPNLATEDGLFGNLNIAGSIALALTSFNSQLLASTPLMDRLKLRLGSLISAEEQAEIKIRAITREYGQAQQTLSAKGSVNFKDQNYDVGQEGFKKMKEDFEAHLATINTDAQQAYRAREGESRQRTSSLGQKIAFGAGGIGGVASAIGDRFNPTAGAAINEFAQGVQLAGQSLSAFPSNIGKALAVGTTITSIFSALDVGFKGLASARREFDTAQGKYQKLASQLDGLTVTLNNYDTLVNDSAVSLETLIRESRKFSELMAQMSETREGRRAVTNLIGAPDNRSRINRLQSYREEEARKLDRQASVLSAREYANRRQFQGLGMKFGDAFSYSNDFEKEEVTQVKRGLTSSALGSLDNDFKQKLTQAANTPTEFNKMVEESRGDLKDFLNGLEKTIGASNVSQVVENLRQSLKTEGEYNSPEAKAQLKGLQERNADRQLFVDSAIRSAATTRRLFVNQGSRQAGNVLDLRASDVRGQLTDSLVGIARKQATSGLYQLQYGERTNREYQSSIEFDRIEAERKNKEATVRGGASRQIVDALSQNFDDYLRNSGQGITGAGQSNIGLVSEGNSRRIEALNAGIVKTVSGGALTRFQKNGTFDPVGLISEISKNSSGDKATQKSILDYLQGQNTDGLIKIIESTNTELININHQAVEEAKKQTVALEGFRAEMDFKQLSTYMGGIKSLLDRNSRRGTERDFIRNLTLLKNGTTPEIRGMAGAGLLDVFKRMNVPIDLSGKSNLSKLMVEAWNAGVGGMKDVAGAMTGRIAGSVGRLTGPDSIESRGMADFSNVDLNKVALAAMQAEFKPENKDIVSSSQDLMGKSTAAFDAALKNSISDVKAFGNILIYTAKEVADSSKRSNEIREAMEKAGHKDAGSLPFQREQERKMRQEQQKRLEETKPSTWDVATSPKLWFGGAGDDRMNEVLKGEKTGAKTNIAGNVLPAINALGSMATFFLLWRAGRKGGGEATSPIMPPPNIPNGGRGLRPNETGFFPAPPPGPGSKWEQAVSRTQENMYSRPLTQAEILAQAKDRQFGPAMGVPKDAPKAGRGTMYPTTRTPAGVFTPSAPVVRIPADFRPQRTVVPPMHPDFPYMSEQQRWAWVRSRQNPVVTRGPMIPLRGGASNVGFMSPMGMPMGAPGGGFGMNVGSMALSMGMQYAGMKAGGGMGNALMMGSMFAPMALQYGAARFGGLAAAGSRLGPLGIPLLGVAAGVGINKWRAEKANTLVTGGALQANKDTFRNVDTMLSQGKSEKEIQSRINYALAQVENQKKNVTGVWHTLAGEGGQREGLEQAAEQLRQLSETLKERVQQRDMEKKQEEAMAKQEAFYDKFLAAMTGQGQGGGKVESSIKVEISVKDAEKIPEMLMEKLIAPLKKQLTDIQATTNILVNKDNPQPAKVG